VAHQSVIRVGFDSTGPWRREGIDLLRAVSGGLLFGVPLLYTMEVWWTGQRSSPSQTAAVLGLLFLPTFALNKTAGFRRTRDIRLRDALADTVETVAVGMVVTAGVLILLRQVRPETPAAVAAGMVLYESIPFCLGVGVARHFLRGTRDGGGGPDQRRSRAPGRAGGGGTADLRGTFDDLGAAAIGAVFIALSIAPTDEIPMIAATMQPAWVLAFMAVSLAVSYAIVFAAGFAGQDRRHAQEGVFQNPLTETVACYLVALAVAAVLLGLFQRGLDPWSDVVTRVVILGFPAAVGGAAGRLAI
jgi:putative integral membrane protein (TIGR02587 family)